MSDIQGGRGVFWVARRASPLLLFLLTGCGSDRPYLAPPEQDHQAQAKPVGLSSATAPTPSGPPDPMVGDVGKAPPDPLAGRDPLLGGDSMLGRAMPTQHSHWIQCSLLHDARVTVLLNGVRYKSYAGVFPGDDITMKLREGANTVTFVYQPGAVGSAADLAVVEGEHHPPIAPLVTFHTQSFSADRNTADEDAAGGDTLKPVTQTFQFMAN